MKTNPYTEEVIRNFQETGEAGEHFETVTMLPSDIARIGLACAELTRLIVTVSKKEGTEVGDGLKRIAMICHAQSEAMAIALTTEGASRNAPDA